VLFRSDGFPKGYVVPTDGGGFYLLSRRGQPVRERSAPQNNQLAERVKSTVLQLRLDVAQEIDGPIHVRDNWYEGAPKRD
jgi:hypothetical protein